MASRNRSNGLSLGWYVFGAIAVLWATPYRRIFASDETRRACENTDLRFEAAGSEELKGFSEPVALFVPH